MEQFKKRQIAFLIQLLAISGLLFAVHSYLLHYFATGTTFFFPVWQIYSFHLVVTLLLYTAINYKYSSGKTEVLNLFMGLTLLKMVLSILFLLPLIVSDLDKKQPDVFNFFIPYFLFLFLEVFALTRFLEKPQ